MIPIEPYDFFTYKKERFLVDMRAPSLFEKGSLPGAISHPFEQASSFASFSKKVIQNANGKSIHLFDQDESLLHRLAISKETGYLKGGYSAFLAWRKQCYTTHFSLFVLGGYTGSGKTQILSHLKEEGLQVLDLEHLAKHRGSIFGGHPLHKQESHPEFQHLLLNKWLSLAPNKPLILEEKGPFLGSVSIPTELYERMKRAPLLHLDLPFSQRVDHILSAYAHLSGPSLDKAIEGLSDRMGKQLSQRALNYLHSGERKKCVELLLAYYDQAYRNRREQYWEGGIQTLPCEKPGDLSSIQIIKDHIQKMNSPP